MKSRLWRRLFYFNLTLLVILGVARFRLEYLAVLASPPTSWTADPKADCAVALTGGPGRVREGVDLLYRGAVKKLIISGVHPQVTWRRIVPQLPFYGDLKEEDVILEKRSTTTYGNAIQTLPLVEALHCRSLVLITSSLHMHRALRTFRSVFPASFPIVVHAVVGNAYYPSFWDTSFEALKSVFYSTWAY